MIPSVRENPPFLSSPSYHLVTLSPCHLVIVSSCHASRFTEQRVPIVVVGRFVDHYLANAGRIANEVGYVGLPERAYSMAKQRFEQRKPGSVFGGKGSQVGVTVEQLLSR